jgi:addiction module RelE/StbE family toxin
MRVIWTNPARNDLREHVLYLAERNPEAARRVRAAIRAAVEALVDHPHRGRPGEIADTRELVITDYPAYIVVYRVTQAEVRILRVWHGRQDWRR